MNLCQGRFKLDTRKRFLLLPCFDYLELDDGTKRVRIKGDGHRVGVLVGVL